MKPSSQYDRYDPRQVSQELNNHSNQTKVSNYETSSVCDFYFISHFLL